MKKERGFTQQLFLTYSSVVFILMGVLFIGVFIIFYNDKIQKEINAQQEFVLKTQQQIDTSLQNMDRIVNGLLFNKAFVQIMKNGNIVSSYSSYSNEILDIMVSLDAPLFLSHRIIAFTKDTYFTFAKTGEDHAHILSAVRSYVFYDRLISADGGKVILPVHADPFSLDDVPVYSVARAVTDGINIYGIVEVQNNYRQLEALCAVDSRLGGIIVMSMDGEAVYPMKKTDNGGFSYTHLYEKIYENIAQKQNGSGSFQWENQQVSYIVSEYSRWIIIMYCPLSYFAPDFSAISVFMFSLAAAFVSVLSLIHILTKWLTAPLSELNKLISQVSFENLSIPMPHSYRIVEIENIKRSFQTTLNQLKVEIARNAEARANEERANTIALQSQMNPHTIYNTITMIESVCYMNGDFEASNLCISFSQMLRYISDNTKSVYTVEDELQYLAHYAALIKKRYESRLEIDISVDESLLSKVMPKFTLQPLVENSVKHGMNRNSNPFIVRVRIEKEPSLWRVIVSDNGTGFTEEKLHGVFEQFANCDASLLDHKSDILKTKIDNMALNNIYIRWRIAMGARFMIRIENSEPSGCFVELSAKE